jgi:hypothetical protein
MDETRIRAQLDLCLIDSEVDSSGGGSGGGSGVS